jgi:uncharacterized protein
MPVTINLRHLERDNVLLEGKLPSQELDIETLDEMIRLGPSLKYRLDVEKLETNLLVQGELQLVLQCQCVRCLKPFEFELKLDPWTCHVALEGEDAAPVVNDCVDLTPYIREDILLELPQHPLCDPECQGLPKVSNSKAGHGGVDQDESGSSAWSALNQLKLK